MAGYDPDVFPQLGVLDFPYKLVVNLDAGVSVLSRVDGDRADEPLDDVAEEARLRELLGHLVDHSLNDAWLDRKTYLQQTRKPRMPRAVHGYIHPPAGEL